MNTPKNNLSYPLASSTWGTEELAAVNAILQSGNYTMGETVRRFESEFASYIGTDHALMVNSGSSANLIMVAGLRYRNNPLLFEGDEVIVPSVSWSTTYYPIQQLGMVLKFVDVDLKTLNLDTAKLEKAINKKTKAIFAVNLLGNPSSFNELERICKEYGLVLIEDNCESLGAEFDGTKTGAIGLAGTHSFFFSHHMCTMEGGMITTNDTALFEAMYSLRAHGWVRGLPENNSVSPLSSNEWENQFKFVLPGYNLRPLEIEAAAGLEQLIKLPGFIEARVRNGEYFLERAKNYPEIITQEVCGDSSWFGFSIILDGALRGTRSELIRQLELAGIQSRPIVAGNFLKNPVIGLLPHVVSGEMNSAERIDEDGFFLGNHHFSIQAELDLFFDVFSKFVDSKKESR
jgi:CDP-6-deoxy-D-xylo-4-hexulose-3-dehydrase